MPMRVHRSCCAGVACPLGRSGAMTSRAMTEDQQSRYESCVDMNAASMAAVSSPSTPIGSISRM